MCRGETELLLLSAKSSSAESVASSSEVAFELCEEFMEAIAPVPWNDADRRMEVNGL